MEQTETGFDSDLSELEYETVSSLRKELMRKYEASDVTVGEFRGDLAELAERYVSTYQGTFEFVQDLVISQRKYGYLTPGQAKGALNCIVAEYNRYIERRRAQESEETFEVDLTSVKWRIPDGKFTLVRGGEANKTYKIKTLDQDHCDRYQKPTGTRMMMFLSGPDNQSDYSLCAWVMPNGKLVPRGEYKEGTPLMIGAQMLLDMDRSGALATAKAFALWSNRCAICGAELTDATSIEMGIGPICRSKFF